MSSETPRYCVGLCCGFHRNTEYRSCLVFTVNSWTAQEQKKKRNYSLYLLFWVCMSVSMFPSKPHWLKCQKIGLYWGSWPVDYFALERQSSDVNVRPALLRQIRGMSHQRESTTSRIRVKYFLDCANQWDSQSPEVYLPSWWSSTRL